MIYVIFGPTGSGKTDVAIKLAQHLNAPIINADAFQIYKDMNIGTNKISQNDEDYQRHYLLDIKSPEETYSVKDYQTDFRRTFDVLKKQYKNIIVCGGTGLYIKAALYDYSFADEEMPDKTYDDKTNEELFAVLRELDFETSQKIHVNNRKRLVRALNICEKNSITKSEIINRQSHKLFYDDAIEFLFLNPDRNTLYEDINNRVDLMFDNGLINEVKMLLNKYKLSDTAKQGIGYKEVIDYLNGQISFEECSELIKKRTRNYAKRQVTFFKNQFKYSIFASKNELLCRLINGK